MLRNAARIKILKVKRRIFDAKRNVHIFKKMHDKERKNVDKNKLKAEIERIENIKRNKASKYIHDELNQYLKLLKRQLKQAEKE